MTRLRLALAWIFTAACIVSTSAMAHAFLDHAQPAVGSTMHDSPASVRLWFTQQLEPAFSRVRVEDATGKAIDKSDSHVDDADRSLLAVDLPSLPPGTYRVRWRVVSVDTHVTEGDFTFTIGK